MSAASAIVGKDLRELRRDGRALLAILLFVLLGLAAVALSAVRISTNEAARSEAEARERRTWLSQGPANPHSVAHFSMYAFRPQGALALFEPGLTPVLGEAIWLEAHAQNPARFRAIEDASEARRFADLSPAWAIAVVLPLVVIAIGFGALAREREEGLWRSVAAVGTPARALLQGKATWLGGAALLLAALVTLPTLAAAARLPAGADDAARWAGVVVAVLLYVAAVAGLVLAGSAAARTSRAALLGLLAGWMVTVVLVPRLATAAADAFAPVPSAAAFQQAVRADLEKGIDGHSGADERKRALEAATLKRYGVARVEDLPVSMAGIALQASEEHGNAVFDHRFGELEAAHAKQQAILRGFGLLSPAVALRNATTALAGTDAHAHWAFARAGETHRRDVVKRLNDDMTANARGQDFEYKAGPGLWRTFDAFVSPPPPAPGPGPLIDLLILALWGVVAWTAAWAAMRRWSAL